MTATAPATELRIEEGFPRHALPRLWQWIEAVWNYVADDMAPQDYDAFEAEWFDREGSERRFAVYQGDRIGGLITVSRLAPWLVTMHLVFSKTFWGQSITRPALIEVIRRVFDDNDEIEKVQAVTFSNGALIALAKSVGFEREGRLRRQTRQHGEFVDMFVLGLLREDFDQCLGQHSQPPESAHSPAP